MTKKQKRKLARILAALALFAIAEAVPFELMFPQPQALYAEFLAFALPYLVAGYDVLLKAGRGIARGQVLDENFLMAVASLGAFALVAFPETEPHMAEGAAVMIFYQIGEWFEGFAVARSRKSIAEMMDIAPEFANVMRDGELVQVSPESVSVGDEIVVRPGERIPLDGTVVNGSSQLDTTALTGEAVPRVVDAESEVASGCINMTGVLTIEVTRPLAESTVTRILELVENASERKARAENFITRFARYYTPLVVGIAVLLALVPPALFGQSWSDWIQRGLVFLVVSCPCALVISVPLSFFGGIGGASRQGVLVKGGNHLETLSQVRTVAFDKTGTLTRGSFNVIAIHPHANVDPELVLSLAAHAETYSSHPIALSIKEAYAGKIDREKVRCVQEESGHGVQALVDERTVLIGNSALMSENGISWHECELAGTIVHVSLDGNYIGHLVIADILKDDAQQAISDLRDVGVAHTVILSGDRTRVARAIADELGVDEMHAELFPEGKVAEIERLIRESQGDRRLSEASRPKVAFVGDGINDAPVLMRSDVGIAMGALGSAAAIEAADIVLMDDNPTRIATAIRIAKKTMRIVWQNIVFALGVKFAVLGLAVFGLANMWLAVFADVGVACLAILNAMRAMRSS